MSITPMDMQISIQRTTEVSSLHNDAARAHVHQHFADEFKRVVELKEHQVNVANKSEGQNIDKDGRGSNGQGSRRKNLNNNSKNENDEKAENVKDSNSFFDFKV